MAYSKIAIRGVNPENTDNTVAIATFNSLSSEAVNEMMSNTQSVEAFIGKVQEVTSTRITKMTVSTEPAFSTEEIGTPGDPLDSAEIFSAEFSDTKVVPTLQIKSSDGDKTRTFNVKYMADPENTANFETKVTALASELGDMTNTTFTSADLTFTARDEVMRAD